jgi:hypothetical protein
MARSTPRQGWIEDEQDLGEYPLIAVLAGIGRLNRGLIVGDVSATPGTEAASRSPSRALLR